MATYDDQAFRERLRLIAARSVVSIAAVLIDEDGGISGENLVSDHNPDMGTGLFDQSGPLWVIRDGEIFMGRRRGFPEGYYSGGTCKRLCQRLSYLASQVS